jgi:hypothetical protein
LLPFFHSFSVMPIPNDFIGTAIMYAFCSKRTRVEQKNLYIVFQYLT